jgi:hypothetical protein
MGDLGEYSCPASSKKEALSSIPTNKERRKEGRRERKGREG